MKRKAMIRPTRYARPCDEPAPGWCVAEVEIGPKGAKWVGTLYEPALTVRGMKLIGRPRWEKHGMTRNQATKEARLWNELDRDRYARQGR
jgi:hypothetical protein